MVPQTGCRLPSRRLFPTLYTIQSGPKQISWQACSERTVAANPAMAHATALVDLGAPMATPKSRSGGVVNVIAHDRDGRASRTHPLEAD